MLPITGMRAAPISVIDLRSRSPRHFTRLCDQNPDDKVSFGAAGAFVLLS